MFYVPPIQPDQRSVTSLYFQTTIGGAECLRRSDAGWQSVPDTRRSDEERASPIVVRHEDGVTRADVDEDRSLFILYPRPPHDLARSPGTAKDENREFKLYPG